MFSYMNSKAFAIKETFGQLYCQNWMKLYTQINWCRLHHTEQKKVLLIRIVFRLFLSFKMFMVVVVICLVIDLIRIYNCCIDITYQSLKWIVLKRYPDQWGFFLIAPHFQCNAFPGFAIRIVAVYALTQFKMFGNALHNVYCVNLFCSTDHSCVLFRSSGFEIGRQWRMLHNDLNSFHIQKKDSTMFRTMVWTICRCPLTSWVFLPSLAFTMKSWTWLKLPTHRPFIKQP